MLWGLNVGDVVSAVGILVETGGFCLLTIDILPDYRAYQLRQRLEALVARMRVHINAGLSSEQHENVPVGYRVPIERLSGPRLERLLTFAGLEDREVASLCREARYLFLRVIPSEVPGIPSGDRRDIGWLASAFLSLSPYVDMAERALPFRWRPNIGYAALIALGGMATQLIGVLVTV